MTDIGLAKIEAAKQNGQWDKPDRPDISFDIPEEFKKALEKNSVAKEYFEQLAPTYRKQFIGWMVVAKRPETKEKRINGSIKLLAKGQKLGLK